MTHQGPATEGPLTVGELRRRLAEAVPPGTDHGTVQAAAAQVVNDLRIAAERRGHSPSKVKYLSTSMAILLEGSPTLDGPGDAHELHSRGQCPG